MPLFTLKEIAETLARTAIRRDRGDFDTAKLVEWEWWGDCGLKTKAGPPQRMFHLPLTMDFGYG